MKILYSAILLIVLSSLVFAECDLCNNLDLTIWENPSCDIFCIDGTLTQECKTTLCSADLDKLSADCKTQYCAQSSNLDIETRLSSLEIKNQNDHNNFNILLNNLRTEINNLKSQNGQLKDELDSIQRDMQEMPSPLKQNFVLYIMLAVITAGLFVLGYANKQQLQKIIPHVSKITPEQKVQIQSYINSYSRSYSKEQIIQGLKQQGFKDEQIKQAYT